MLKYLLQLGARPNITDAQGQTPLHLAAQQSNAEIVEFLLADPRTNARQFDNFGQQPLLYATN